MLTLEQTEATSNIDPEFKEVLDQNPQLFRGWTMSTDLYQIRAIIAQMRKKSPPPKDKNCIEEDIEVPIRDGNQITVRVHKPLNRPDDGCPGMVVYHGGGFVVGDVETEAWLCHLFASLGGISVDVQYRHAPEHPFPSPIFDSFDGLKWVAENVQKLGINPEKGFILAGESAGADLALTVAHLYRDSRGSLPPLTGIYAAGTSALTEESVPEKYKPFFTSMKQNAEAPLLTAESVAFVRKNYKPDLTSPLAAPVLFDHTGIPKTYFQAFGLDPVRDCTLITNEVWQEAGIKTKLDLYPGLPHAFYVQLPGLHIQDKKYWQKHYQDSLEALKWLLSG